MYIIYQIKLLDYQTSMIKQLTNLLIKSNKLTIPRYFGSSAHHAPTPTKLERVTDTTVKFNVKNCEGQWEQVHAFVGETFLNAVIRMKVNGAYNISLCYGNDFVYQPHERPHDPFSSGPVCGLCRIVLIDNWHEKIMEQTDGMTKEEEVLLEQFPDTRKQTRLACCLPVEKWMNGCTFEIYTDPKPSENTNFT